MTDPYTSIVSLCYKGAVFNTHKQECVLQRAALLKATVGYEMKFIASEDADVLHNVLTDCGQ